MMNESLPPPLALAELGAIDSLELRASVLVSGFLAGLHRSSKAGSCPEFREFREYRPGDPLRGIDWRASARGDRLLMRLREDETNLHCQVLLDSSRSMAFRGARACMSKWEYARMLAAALLLLLQSQQDSPGLSIVGAELEDDYPPSARRTNVLRMLAGLERAAVGDASGIVPYLARLAPTLGRRAMVIVISDFYTDAERLRETLAQLAATGRETLLLQVLDPAETTLEWESLTLLRVLEGEGQLLVHPDLEKRTYERALSAHLRALQTAAAACASHWALCLTEAPPMRALSLALRCRTAARGGRR